MDEEREPNQFQLEAIMRVRRGEVMMSGVPGLLWGESILLEMEREKAAVSGVRSPELEALEAKVLDGFALSPPTYSQEALSELEKSVEDFQPSPAFRDAIARLRADMGNHPA